MMIITTIRYYNGTINWWQFEQIYLAELGHNYRSKRTNHRNTHINHTKIKTEPQTYTLTHSGFRNISYFHQMPAHSTTTNESIS